MYSLFKSSVDTTKVLEKQQILLHFREDMLRLKKKQTDKVGCKHHFFYNNFQAKIKPTELHFIISCSMNISLPMTVYMY